MSETSRQKIIIRQNQSNPVPRRLDVLFIFSGNVFFLYDIQRCRTFSLPMFQRPTKQSFLPEWHSKMDRALACHMAARVQTRTQFKFTGLPSSWVHPSPGAFSPAMPVVMCSTVNTCNGGGKKRGIMVKS